MPSPAVAHARFLARSVGTAQLKGRLDQLLANDCGRHCEPGHYASTPCRKKDDG